MLFLKLLGAIAALGIGIYLGLAGQYRPDPDEIERSLGAGGRTRRTKRHFTPLGWLRRTDERSSRMRRRTRGGSRGRFNLAAPKKKD